MSTLLPGSSMPGIGSRSPPASSSEPVTPRTSPHPPTWRPTPASPPVTRSSGSSIKGERPARSGNRKVPSGLGWLVTEPLPPAASWKGSYAARSAVGLPHLRLRMVARDFRSRLRHQQRRVRLLSNTSELQCLWPRGSSRDEATILHDLVRAIDGDHTHKTITSSVQSQEPLVLCLMADHPDLIGLRGADELNPAAVPIRPEIRHRRRCLCVTRIERVLGSQSSLLRRVRPMLEPHDLTVEQGIWPVRDISSGVNSWYADA